MNSELLWILGVCIVTAIGVYLKRRYGTNPLSAIELMLRRVASLSDSAEMMKLKDEHKAGLVKLKADQQEKRMETAAKMITKPTGGPVGNPANPG